MVLIDFACGVLFFTYYMIHSMKTLNIARAGWGTGGHVFPIKSLIQYLQTHSDLRGKVVQMFRFGTSNSLEQETCSELQKNIKNLTFHSIYSWKRRREKGIWALIKNIRDLFLFTIGLFQSVFYLLRFKIDVVFCKGGYVALPVVFVAKLLGKKIIVHESDVHPWLVNRIAGKFSAKNFSGFPWVLPKTQVVGQILSEDLLPAEESPFFSNKRQTQVLVMWGSQGSKNLYQALAKVLKTTPELAEMHFTIILGKLNQDLAQLFSDLPNVETLAFVSQKEIGRLYLQSDIAITRAGTTSLAEQELFDMKLLMIPIPRTHDQLDNAKRYVEHKNWILIQQDDPDFLDQLKNHLLALQSFKKKLSSRDRKAEIRKAKDQILEQMLE